MAWDDKEVARHDEHQKATLKYALEIIKLLFVLSGGALATCSAFFSGTIGLPSEILLSARWAWISLTASMLLFSLALVVVLARDYVIGERWRAAIEQDKDWGFSVWWDICAWTIGLAGLAAFWVGMIAFAAAAWSYLGQTSILLAPALL